MIDDTSEDDSLNNHLLSSDTDSESEYETDEEEIIRVSEIEKKKIEKDLLIETEQMSLGFSKRAIQLLINTEGGNISVDDKSNTIDIIDDKLYEHGETHDIAYVLGLDCVSCEYNFNTTVIDNCIKPTVMSYVGQLIQSIQMSYPKVAKNTIGEKLNLTFEPQTMTFYVHYNSYNRIGVTIKCMPLDEYHAKSKGTSYNTMLEEIK